MSEGIDFDQLHRFWHAALAEDGAGRDITSQIAVDPRDTVAADIVMRGKGVFAGKILFDLLQNEDDHLTQVTCDLEDGAVLNPGMPLAHLAGPMPHVLTIERTLLNFLQRLCGVATITRRYVDAVAGTSASIFDTRKTIPGWRQLDKYAVRCGGGQNHRAGLHDAVLIKDNHLVGIPASRLAAAVFDMLNRAASLNPPPTFIECEVDSLEQFDALLDVVGIDVILLDNFSLKDMHEAVKRRDNRNLKGKVALEASGGVTLEQVRTIADTGVERIAVGAITHSAPAIDIAMECA